MAGLGGAIKLKGESEYQRALKQIKQNLREVSSEMKIVSSSFDKNDNSTSALNAKSEVLNKTLDAQKQKLKTLQSQYSDFSAKIAQQTAKHENLVNTYNKEKQKLEEIEKTLGASSKEYQDQKAKVEQLAQAVSKSSKNQEANAKSMSEMRVQMNNAQADINKTTKSLDELGNEAEESGKKAKDSSDGFTVMKGVLSNLATDAIHLAVDGLKKLGGALVDIGKQAYTQYSSYEQLVGGVDTLFKDSSQKIQNYAANAYKTAGISANQYMEQVTSFSATLLQGLNGDTAKAADIANVAITDMADNANKMGTSMTDIQNAYQGFAKDNYTMLDNLKLGYGGTQAEMARLINDSGVLGDSVKVTANTVKDVPFDKVIEAIHKVQQNIGITGTTSKEAASTIEGSTASVKAAWDNLMIGIADPKNQDIGQLISNFADSLITAMKNSLPRVREIVEGMSEAVKEIWNEVLPELEIQFPELKPIIDKLQWLKDNGPIIASAITAIVTAIGMFKAVSGIITVIDAFKKMHDAIMLAKTAQTALNLTMAANPIGLIIGVIAGLVAAFVTLWNTSEGFRNFWIGLWDGIKSVTSTVVNAIGGFFTNTLPNAIKTAVDWFANLPSNIANFLGQALTAVGGWVVNMVKKAGEMGANFISNVVKFFTQLPSNVWNFLSNVISKVGSWVGNMGTKARQAGSQFLQNVVSFIKQLPSNVARFLSNVISNLGSWVGNMARKGAEGARNLFNAVVNGIKHLPSEVANIGKNIVQGIWNGISGAAGWLVEKVRGFARGILNGMKNALGIHSPSRVFRDEVGKYLAEGIGVGFTDEMKNVTAEMKGAIPTSFDIETSADIKGSSTSGGIGNNFDVMVSAFKQALSEMKIEMDGDEMGKFVDRTVTNLVYA